MSILQTKIALEQRLVAAFPTTKIAFEGVSFEEPDNELYLVVQIRVDRPEDPVFGAKFRREKLSFQIFVVGEQNAGTGAALEVAQSIQELYQRGTTLEASPNLVIQIFSTPQIAGAIQSDRDKVVVPVLIDVTAEVYNF